MKHLILGILILLIQPMFGQVFTSEQKDFCIETFKKYMNVKEELIEERLVTLKLVQSEQEDISEWYRNNVVRIDSVMNASIELVKQDESMKLAYLLEKEQYNIYAHPHNDTYLCYNFHSVLALIYSNTIKNDREYFTKLADLGEYSKMIIEAVQANWNEPHPLYLQVLEELKLIYTELGNKSKIQEIERLIAKFGPKPYNSFGNGSAMRVSPIGWAFDTLEETLEAAKQSAEVTHNHPEGIKGAQATAACIFLARTGKSKQEIKEYIEKTFGYNLSRTCDEIRPDYHFDVTCQGSVPESIIAFLESTDFENAVRLAVSLGGDADTMGAITGSIAEAYYGGIPEHIRKEVLKRLPNEFIEVMQKFYQKFVLK